MTLSELSSSLTTLLTRVGGDRVTAAEVLQACQNIVAYFATQIASIIPDWSAGATFNTDGTGAGKYCKFADANGRKRIFETKVDGNINHGPPTDPSIPENTYWREISASAGAAIPEWAAGVYGPGIIIVLHNHSVDGRGLYFLLDPARPYSSSNIETEITAGKWQRLGGGPGGGGVTSFNDRTGPVEPQAGDYTASQVDFIPTGGIFSSNTQDALVELDNDKENVGVAYSLIRLIPWKPTAKCRTTGPLPANTINGGYWRITGSAVGNIGLQDGIPLFGGDTFLVNDEVDKRKNGLFYVINEGSPTDAYVLERVGEAYNLNGAAVYVTRGTVHKNKLYFQTTPNPTIGTSNIVFEQERVTPSVTLNDVLLFGNDAAGMDIAELSGIHNSTADFELTAPNFVSTIDNQFFLQVANGDIYMDGFNSAVFSSTGGGAYFGGATETVIGTGIEPVSLILPFIVNEGDIFYQGASNRVDALPKGTGNQVVGIIAGSLAWKQLVFSDLNMTSGSLLGRSTVGTGAVQAINPGDGIDLAAGNLNLGGDIANHITFGVPSNVLKSVTFGDYIDLFLFGANSKFRVGFGGTAVSAIQFTTQSFRMDVGRNGTMANLNQLQIGAGLIFTAAGGDATTNDGQPINLRSGVAYNGAGTNGNGGDITLKTDIGFGTGKGGNIILDLATGGLIKLPGSTAPAATSTTVTNKLKINIGGTDWYVCLTATP